jgi:hypothetical protein
MIRSKGRIEVLGDELAWMAGIDITTACMMASLRAVRYLHRGVSALAFLDRAGALHRAG